MMTPAQARKQRRELMKQIAVDHRRQAREKLAQLRHELRDARRSRRIALHLAKEHCKSERLAARARARDMRRRALEELREALKRERRIARETCSADLSAAREITSRVQRARAELRAERSYRRELKRIEHANRAARLEHKRASGRERRGESDEEVRGNIPDEFVRLFERVKGKIRGSDRMTRTEAFMHYAHEHPEEVLESFEDRTAEVIRELEAKERSARRELRSKPPREAYADLPPF